MTMRWMRQIFSRGRMGDDLSEEMRQHLEEKIDVLVERGMAREEAVHAARRAFGNATLMEQRGREVWMWPWIESLWADVKFALRQLRKSPGFTLTAVLTLALGIGATTAIFTLVYATLLRSLPYPEANRIVSIQDVRLQGRSTGGLVSVPRFFDVTARNQSFDDLGFFYFDHPTLIAGTKLPVAVRGAGTNASFWKVFRVTPLLGRTFNEQDDQANAPDTIVLSYEMWQTFFGGARSVINRQVTLDQKSATIIGVMPPGFQVPSGAELWRPAHFDPSQWGKYRGEGTRFINVIARLKAGVSAQLAESDLRRIGEQLRQEHPASDGMWQFRSESLRDAHYGSIKPVLLILMIASFFLLLIACINIANLLLARATTREREVALRRALGASRARILLQFLAESTLLAMIGGGAGLAATAVLLPLGDPMLPGRLGVPGTIEMSWPVAWFAFVVSVVTGIAFGLVPAFQNRHVELNAVLKSGESRLSGASGNVVRSALVSIQVGLSLILLIGASLLAKSIWNLAKSPLGFEPQHLLTFSINLPWNAEQAKVSNFFRNAQQRIDSLPGVTAAGQIDALPTMDWHLRSNFDADWLPRTANRPAINAEERSIAGNYLRAMGIPLLAGRTFTDEDADAHSTPVMVNQELVREYLGGRNAIGRHLLVGNVPHEIIGVIANTRGTAGSLAGTPGPEVYWSADAGAAVQRYFVIRSQVPPEQLIHAIRDRVHQIDPQQAIANVTTMNDLLDKSIAQPRLNAVVVASFAGIALLLACVGIYGIVAYFVTQRIQEIGVRMTFGATRGQIVRLFMRRAAIPTLIGLVAGGSVSFILMHLLRGQLYGVQPDDPIVYLASTVALLAPALIAALRPARRAASIDPMQALRAE